MRRRSPLPALIFFALSACLVAACSFAPPDPPASPTPIASAPTATAEPAPPLTLPTCSFGRGRAPQIASYCMNARLDPDAKTITGIERITYRNPSQDTLKELWLRLYLRAFRNFSTTWMRESRGQMRGDRADPTALGDITISKLALAGGADLLASATLTDTLLRVPLPQPLAPNQNIDLDVNWTSQLPRVFARTGFGGRDDSFFMVGQWYPKMTVYDHGHWDTEPWHANAEFFNDFGSYDVSITTPKAYIVAGGGTPKSAAAEQASATTVRYTADDVTDFAFAASPDFKTRTGKSGDVDVVLYYLPEHEASVAEYMDTSIESLQDYSAWYGTYPHSRLTVVDVPDDAGGAGGMEYPTLVTGGTFGQPAGSGFVALVVSHEIGHQWWPMQTATNEGREPWLDEGLTEYSGMRYMVDAGRKLFFGGQPTDAETFEQAEYGGLRLPATLPSWEYDTAARYFPSVYNKTALGLWTLESVVGTERFRHAMADYLARYRFKHPTGADFRASLERSLGGDLRWFFDDFMNGSGVIDYAVDRNDGRTVTATRAGTVRAPVEIGVTLASGARLLKTWDGQTPSASFTFPAGDPVKKVEIDPEHKLKAEVDRVNNTSVVP